MRTSRRNFVQYIGSAAAAAAVVPGSVVGVLGQMLRQGGGFAPTIDSTLDPLTYLIPDHFRPFVGSSIAARSASGRRSSFRLMDVTDTRREQNDKRGYRGQSYSLVFESNSRMAAEIYSFTHPQLGKFSLFVSPVTMRTNRYEAVVNRVSLEADAV